MFKNDINGQEQAELEFAIAEENAAMSELEKPEDDIPGAPHKKQLVRDTKAAALERLEEAARTKEDFEKVVDLWDKRDANRERKERYHEICRGDNIPLDYNADENGVCFPRTLSKSIWRQVRKGDFEDAIYDCPLEIQELVTEPYMYKILSELSDEHKEILYYIMKGYSTAQIACIREQSERNIRKVKNTMLKKIRKRVYSYLKGNKEHDFTLLEKIFVADYRKGIDNSK
ncbi:MAG: hypothetical protein Q4G33_03120 [bacterium]|nr:hypothetical protein [bacterium]